MGGVWVWIEQHDGKAAGVSWEAVGVGRRLADALGEKVTALAFGANAAALGAEAVRRGADGALVCDDQTLEDFRVDPAASLVSALAKQHGPSVILAGATTRGTDVMGAVAVDLEAGLIADVVEIGVEGGRIAASRPVYAGKLIASAAIPAGIQMFTLRGRAFPAPVVDDARTGSVEAVSPVRAEGDIAMKVSSFEARGGTVSLTEAAIVVAGGRGVGGPEGFEPLRELAGVLGAALGASRATVDAGWIPYEHQVGQTGKVVSPDLYIAAGVSGAVQHQAGMRTSKVIVAINKDADAPIFKLARYGIVGDLFQVVPALTAAFHKRLGK